MIIHKNIGFKMYMYFCTKGIDKTEGVLYIIDTKNKGVDSGEDLKHGSPVRKAVGRENVILCDRGVYYRKIRLAGL